MESPRNIVTGNVTEDNGVYGIELTDGGVTPTSYNSIVGNIATDTRTGGSKTQDYGIVQLAIGDYNKIIGNDVSGNVTKGMYGLPQTNDVVRHNTGYITEISDTATITAAAVTVVVTHGLATTPTRVFVSPTLLSSSNKWWVTAIGATTFTINVDVVPGAGTATFDWQAQIGAR